MGQFLVSVLNILVLLPCKGCFGCQQESQFKFIGGSSPFCVRNLKQAPLQEEINTLSQTMATHSPLLRGCGPGTPLLSFNDQNQLPHNITLSPTIIRLAPLHLKRKVSGACMSLEKQTKV